MSVGGIKETCGYKRDKRRRLYELQDKLGSLTFFDPACAGVAIFYNLV